MTVNITMTITTNMICQLLQYYNDYNMTVNMIWQWLQHNSEYDKTMTTI